MKHRLAKKSFAQRHTVEPADQFALEPGLDGMGVAQTMQLDVGRLHLRGDPGALLTIPRHGGAGGDDFFEDPVEGYFEETLA